MIFLFVIYFFYLINISFFVQAQSCSAFNDTECNENKYYNSMKCSCEDCNDKLINNNICYKIENNKVKSIYDPNKEIECINEKGESGCTNLNAQNVTELDSDGNWLGFLMPARNYIIKDDINGLETRIRQEDFNFRFFSLSNSDSENPNLGESQNIGIPSELRDSIIYYNSSCYNSYYDSSCNILINLCVVAMYNKNNGFCMMIDELIQNFNAPL